MSILKKYICKIEKLSFYIKINKNFIWVDVNALTKIKLKSPIYRGKEGNDVYTTFSQQFLSGKL